ncbi:DUF3164 family protein [Pseudotabrizicola algicola]|uniref:DUF3164 family protein n=1 Tax=Pseudotabrizicola algicola TaxID=2709381 RepID=A0A6B3RS54_9RHOB|nr:DUF3164 family protein [Pseudotabrizicola algicola]NEX47628.1 DUF3164 family protein [Pseudotabrizicola algicola]
MTSHTTRFEPHPVPTGIIEANGNLYMADGKGGLRAVENVPTMKRLQDEQVRKIFGFAFALAAQIARFKGHVYEDLGSFDALMMQDYGLTVGGPKGNRTYSTFDGLMKVEVRIQDRIAYGPEMQIAKMLFDKVLNERAAGADPLIRSIITSAFDTDKEGQINRANVFVLLNVQDDDPEFRKGQEAIRAAMHVIGSKSYLRFQHRDAYDAPWQTLTIDLASA